MHPISLLDPIREAHLDSEWHLFEGNRCCLLGVLVPGNRFRRVKRVEDETKIAGFW
jgi:hypothetical protein